MSYSEWLELLELLKTSSKKEYIEKFLNEPINNNLSQNLKPKIIDMLVSRFSYSVNTIISNIDYIFDDIDLLDIELVNFRKSCSTTLKMIDNIYLDEEDKKNIKDNINEGIVSTFQILEKQALQIDDNGVAYQIIKNNEIKRDDKDEL